LLLPFVSTAEFGSERERNLARGLGLGIAASFLVISLIPGALARYNMPLLVPATWLMAMTLAAKTVAWPKLMKKLASPREAFRSVVGFAVLVCAAILVYTFAVIPRLQHRGKIKTIAAKIDSIMPATAALYAVDPDYQPYLFYVERRVVYVSHLDDVSREARYLLVQPANESAAEASDRWEPLHARPILKIKDYRGREAALLRIGDG